MASREIEAEFAAVRRELDELRARLDDALARATWAESCVEELARAGLEAVGLGADPEEDLTARVARWRREKDRAWWEFDAARRRGQRLHRRAQAAERAVRVAQGETRDAKRNDYYHGWAAADVRERLRRERDAARAELTLRDLALRATRA